MKDSKARIVNVLKANQSIMKPCPFCGKEPVIMSKAVFDELQDESDDGNACITITCHNCDLHFYDHTHEEHDYYTRAFYVISKWNERAGEQDDDEV